MSAISLLNGFVVTVISMCLLLVFAPIILPLLLVFYIWTIIVEISLKFQYGRSATRITGMSALFKQDTPENSSMLNVAFRFSGEMEPNKFRSKLLQILQRSNGSSGNSQYNRLMQVMDKKFGYVFWKDAKNFDVDQHIKIVQLEDLIKPSIERELNQKDRPVDKDYIIELNKLNDNGKIFDWKILMSVFLKEYAMKMIDENLPQWQLLLLKESSERYTFVFRMHHAIADGIYLSRLLSEEILNIPFSDLAKYSYAKPSKLSMFAASVWSMILIPVLLWQIVTKKYEESLLPKQIGKKKYLLSNPVSLDALRNIRKRTDSSINAILCACVSAALTFHFKRRSTISKDIGVLFPIPLQDLLKPIVLTNKFAAVSLRIPTTLPSTNTVSLDRLKMIQSIFEAAKKNPWPMSHNYLIRILSSIFPSDIINYLIPANGLTIGFTNIPGPQVPIYFGDDLLENIMFWAFNTPELLITVSIQSYNGKLCVGLVVDEALLQEENEGDLILSDFENEVQNILYELDNQQNNLKIFDSEEEVMISNP